MKNLGRRRVDKKGRRREKRAGGRAAERETLQRRTRAPASHPSPSPSELASPFKGSDAAGIQFRSSLFFPPSLWKANHGRCVHPTDPPAYPSGSSVSSLTAEADDTERRARPSPSLSAPLADAFAPTGSGPDPVTRTHCRSCHLGLRPMPVTQI